MCMEIVDLRLRFTSKLIHPDQPPYEQTVRGTPNRRRRIFQKRLHSLVFSAPTSRPPASSARASSRAMPLGTGAAASAARLDDARFEAELSSRYADDDADDDAADAADAPGSALAPRDGLAPPPPPSRASAPLARDARSSPSDDDGPGERGWADRMDEFPDDEAWEDDDEAWEDDPDDDDDDVAHALESLDVRDDVAARGGHHGGGLATHAAWRPNANGGAGNHDRRRGRSDAPRVRGVLPRGGERGPPRGSRAAANADLLRRHGPALDKKIRTGGIVLDAASDRFGGSGASVPQRVNNAMRESERKRGNERSLTKDKEDRATVEQALDPRTRLILFKMLSRGVFSEIFGCISTGKEANVYHAVKKCGGGVLLESVDGRERSDSDGAPTGGEKPMGSPTDGVSDASGASDASASSSAKKNPPPGEKESSQKVVFPEEEDLAVKVYKTSILVFKDRDRYVSGDWRWRNGYSRKNPRKMVQTWAEKEMRNLIRLREAGLRVPEVRLLRSHVLVMSFVGSDGRAAPRLKDAIVSDSKRRELFRDLLLDVRAMYQRCRLVHADFSEYNILVHEGKAWIIDVSQSVDLDHPRCLDFLREDLLHLGQFFAKRGVAVPTVREMFEFVTDPAITDDNVDRCVEALNESAVSRAAVGRTRGDGGEGAGEVGEGDESRLGRLGKGKGLCEGMVDEVFQRAFIPKRLDEVHAFERDQARLAKAAAEGGVNGEGGGASGEVEGVYYQSITGMRRDLSGVETTPKILRAREEANKRSSGWAGVAVTTSAEARRREARGGSDAVEPESSKASIDATERAISSKGGAGGGDGPSGVVPDSGDGDGRSDGSDDSSDDSSDESSDGDDDASEVDSEGNPIEGTRRRFPKKPPVDKAAVKAARKANKAEVKAEAAERRKTKIKKHVKKKAVGKNKKR